MASPAACWEPVRLGSLLAVKHGYAFKGEFFEDSGEAVVLTPGNFRVGGGLQLRDGKEKYYSAPYSEEFLLAPGDLLLAMTDLKQDAPILGCPIVIPDSGQFLHNQRLGKVVDVDAGRLYRLFAYYLFIWDGVRAQIRGSATGATVRHTAPTRIYDVQFKLPPLLAQRKIAAILSAYDDLIENNARRIKILEETAQRIYQEWFVEFRFPGNEDAQMADSELGPIPEGWREESLSSLADLKWGDTSKTKRSYSASGYEVFSASGADGKSENYDFDLDGVVLSAIGAKCGKTWLAKGKWSCIKNTIRFWSDSPDVSTEYLYMATNSEDFWPKRGAAQPFIAQTDARAKRIAVPTHEVMRRFTDHLGPILDAIHVLSRTSENLRTIREILLPRLISGEIDVEALDIDTSGLAA
jgi:type I restriction enzyme, S subunit